MQQPLLAVSIDLDGLDLYAGLFGLTGPLPESARETIPGLATARFCELCASLGVRGTLFVVGRDVAAGRGRQELLAAAAAGHELANHSWSHDYALSRRTLAVIDDDLGRADDALQALTGVRPVGFRAPGYTVSPTLIETVRRRGYRYDSSLMPSPPYYAAKVAVISALTVLGRTSHSIIGAPGQLFRPRGPHRDSGVLELPIAVVPGLRLPFYGSVLASLPGVATRALARTLASERLVVIELHGADLVDESDGIPAEIAARQRDMRIPASVKRTRIEGTLRELLQNRRGVTLADAAGLWSDRAEA